MTGVVRTDEAGYYFIQSNSNNNKYYFNNEILHNPNRGLGSVYVLQANVNGEPYRFIKNTMSNSTRPHRVTRAHFPINTRVKFIGIDKVPFVGKSNNKTIRYELLSEAAYAAVEIERDES